MGNTNGCNGLHLELGSNNSELWVTQLVVIGYT